MHVSWSHYVNVIGSNKEGTGANRFLQGKVNQYPFFSTFCFPHLQRKMHLFMLAYHEQYWHNGCFYNTSFLYKCMISYVKTCALISILFPCFPLTSFVHLITVSYLCYNVVLFLTRFVSDFVHRGSTCKRDFVYWSKQTKISRLKGKLW